jgi:hypothetical protein
MTATGDVEGASYVTITSTQKIDVQNVTSDYWYVTLHAASSGSGDLKTKTVNANGGNADLQQLGTTSGDIDINGDLNAYGDVNIVGKNAVKVHGSSGNVSSTGYGNVFMKADGELAVNNVSGGSYGNVDIKGNRGSGTSAFIIGAAADTNTNGINGTVTSSYAIYITNGADGATADMTLLDPAKLTTPGYLILNAQHGTLTMNTGSSSTLSVNGTGGQNNQIQLMAQTVAFDADYTLSANNTTTTQDNGVAIAARYVNYQGSGGLTIQANGSSGANGGFAELLPLDATTITDGEDYTSLYIGVSNGTTTASPVSLTGSGSAPLTVTTNGPSGFLGVFASSMSFSGGPVTMNSKGDSNNVIYIEDNASSFTGASSLSFTGTGGSGAVVLDASGDGAAGGFVSVYVDHASIASTSFAMHADGPSSGDGDGGRLYLYSTQLTLDPGTTASLTANAASSGSGNATYGDPTTSDPLAITFYPNNDIALGAGNGQYSFSANGGSSGGDAGTILINPNGNVTVTDQQVVTASALGGNGDGGWIYIPAYITSATISNITTPWAIVAQGYGSGTGGQVFADHSVTDLNVNALIKVDGGSSLGSTDSDGIITLNNVVCQQWLTGLGYPTTYWNCIDTSRSTGMPVATAAGTLPAGLKSLLGSTLTDSNPSVQIYAMFISSDFGTFFDHTGLFGNGIYGFSINVNRVSASFQDVYVSGSPTAATSPSASGSATIMQGVIVHELGHQLDYIWGNLSSTNATFLADRITDLTTLLNSMPICTAAFTAGTCGSLPANDPSTGNPWASNLRIYQYLGFSTSNVELFPIVFEHLESVANASAYAVQADLESVVGSQFAAMSGYISGLIAAPPSAVN